MIINYGVLYSLSFYPILVIPVVDEYRNKETALCLEKVFKSLETA